MSWLHYLYEARNIIPDLPPYGMEYKQIGFAIVIDREGKFVDIEDMRLDNQTAPELVVPISTTKSTNITPNYLWENSKYIFGIRGTENSYKVADKEFNAFKNLIRKLYELHPENDDVCALWKFYNREREAVTQDIQNCSMWNTVMQFNNKGYSYFTFRIEGETELLTQKKDLLAYMNEVDDREFFDGLCMVTGKRGKIVKTMRKITFPGCSQRVSLSPFQVDSGYDMYGKKQGQNCPISPEAEFHILAVLQQLLRRDSHNKFTTDNMTLVFWPSVKNETTDTLAEVFYQYFNWTEDENADGELLWQNFQRIYDGKELYLSDVKFYMIGFVPNGARVAVVLEEEMSLSEFASAIIRHHEEMEIVEFNGRLRKGLKPIIAETVVKGTFSDANKGRTKGMVRSLSKSVIEGSRYPVNVYNAIMGRALTERTLNSTRAGFIKAYLTRNFHFKTNIMLDKNNSDMPYLCGRLLALYEKIERDANNCETVALKFMRSASTTPAKTMPLVANLTIPRINKLNEDRRIFYEQIENEIIDKMDSHGYPLRFSLAESGEFLIGFYQQKADFYKKKNVNENKEEE